MANAQADRVRQLEDQLEQLRMNQDPLGKLDEEVRDLEAQGAKEREKKKAKEAEAQRQKLKQHAKPPHKQTKREKGSDGRNTKLHGVAFEP
jgi:septal ring factor EnvC (AmiA/AmiB activator)